MILAALRIPHRPVHMRRSVLQTEEKPKFYYKIKVASGIEYDLCSHAYMSVHGVRETRVRYTYNKASQSATGTPAPDARGRHK